MKRVACLLTVLTLSGCAGAAGSRGSDLDTLLTAPLDSVGARAADDAHLSVVDRSRVVGAGAPDPAPTAASRGWLVVAVCADSPRLADARDLTLAVVPAPAVDARTYESIQMGGYIDELRCAPGEFRAVP